MRIVVLGGTFNPIHYGHLRGAEEAREATGSERVIFIPAAVPPHKLGQSITPAELRLRMVEIAIEGNARFEVSAMEIERGGNSYTVDTIAELLASDSSLEISLLIGADSFAEITTWYRYEEIFKLVDLVIMPRPGTSEMTPGEALPVELGGQFWYDSKSLTYINKSSGKTVTYLGSREFDLSSSGIREMVAEGRSIRYLTPPGVERFIMEEGLYRE